MKSIPWLLVGLFFAGQMSAAFAAEEVCYFISPEAEPGTGQTVTEALLGNTPIIPAANAGPNAVINWQLWCHIQPNPALGRPDSATTHQPYLKMTSGGFDIFGSNSSVKGTSLNLFRTYNTAASERRWDSTSATQNGMVGAGSYLWQRTLFDYGFLPGIQTDVVGPPSGPDFGANDWLIAGGTFQVGPGGVNAIGGFFDVFLELRNNSWGTQPGQPVADLAWGFDDAGESFLASQSINGGRRSTHPEMRIRPEPATLALLALGGLLAGVRVRP